ncbi:DNA-binding transcriptional regulator, AcrR family [Thermomonospora echinospora]|uniref:DNA-binding transcriptional regulator, AcrR family n=1 Tax=Thermomonospora echinospora TaxID=1992 RepID=A0A1H5T7Y4_9ACTN|nr:TetR/AcrR family transcriptional regulator [Thermomonospora echinospora]SEF58925.1 DNA-binding transcriptional regulator, AcrR family [Thermomonospora echinospora]
MTERSLREQRREQRRALSRDQILDAAEQVFAREGFHQASLREIAELAEFSVGTVYGLFTGKDELYREIFLRRAAEFLPGMRDVLDSGRPPRRQLLDLADWQVGFFRRFPQFGRLVLRGGAIAPPLSEPPDDSRILENFRASQQMQAELFRRGQQAGQLRAGDPMLLARMFSGLVSAFQTAELDAGQPPDGGERLPLAQLHEVLEAAFTLPGA